MGVIIAGVSLTGGWFAGWKGAVASDAAFHERVEAHLSRTTPLIVDYELTRQQVAILQTAYIADQADRLEIKKDIREIRDWIFAQQPSGRKPASP